MVTDNGSPAGPPAASAPATINLTISGPVIWFVDDTAAGGGNGRMSSPFQTIAAVDAVDATGHRIFLYSGSYTNGITLNADERLIGQGVTQGACAGNACFDTVFGISPPANTLTRPTVNGTRPVVSNKITFGGTNGVVRGLNLTPAANTEGIATVAGGADGLTVGEVTVTANNAAAVNFVNSSGTASFTEIDATGGASGIIWNNSAAEAGSLTITGTGTADCTTAANCTGGAIQNTTGPGILLNNLNHADSVTINNLLVQNAGAEGIRATSVTGIDLINVLVHNNGDALAESGVELTNVSGTGSLSNSTLSQNSGNNLLLENASGSTTFSVTGSVIKDGVLDPFGNDGILVSGSGAANMTLNVTGSNTFSNPEGDHIQVGMSSTATGTYVTNIQNNTFTNTPGSGSAGSGITITNDGSTQGTLTFSGNTVTNAVVQSIIVSNGVGNGSLTRATIENNTLGNAATAGSAGSTGIALWASTQTSITALIRNNTIRNWDNPAGAIHVLSNDTCGVNPPGCGLTGGTINATILGNTVANPGGDTTHGIFIQAGSTPDDTNTICADVGGPLAADRNNITGNEANGGADIRVFQRFASTMRLRGYTGAAADTAAVQNYLINRNTMTSASAGAPGGTGYLNTSPAGSACPLP